ncbi:MAG: inorganic phosphate transporter [Zetaproteobacteria bacterium]|nr:inorganic phosphate transporter [Zetaproteobacteria bacterium]
MGFEFSYEFVLAVLSFGMLISACIEVGSNDAANLVNAVFGARILKRNRAVLLAGIFVVFGASFASPVMNTVRKGLFDPEELSVAGAMAVFLTTYLVNTVLLYGYSGYGLPISTTATLIFSLAGAAVGVSGGLDILHMATMYKVIGAIFISVVMSGVAAFLAQRIFRGAMGKNVQDHGLVLLHGPWISGLILVSLSWFMIVKGMKAIPLVKELRGQLFDMFGVGGFLILLWASFAFVIYMVLLTLGKRASSHLFHFTAVLGMICMAFAFGQNDLANCASPGLAIWMLFSQGLEGSHMDIPVWTLVACGILLFLGMNTKRAQRVTRAEINTASQHSKVKLYAPQWCIRLAEILLYRKARGSLSQAKQTRLQTPKQERDEEGKKVHYDTLRASVILAVSASVIALASGLGLPVSTTYVCFASVIATGWGDRVFDRGRAELKVGRALWVLTSWFMGAAIATAASAVVACILFQWKWFGLLVGLALNLWLRLYFKKNGDAHEAQYHSKKKRVRKYRQQLAATGYPRESEVSPPALLADGS